MKTKKPVLIILGEPNSVFTEILSKTLNKITKNKRIFYPIILIGSKKLTLSQLRILNLKLDFLEIKKKDIFEKKLKNKIYFLDVNYKFKMAFEKISKKSKSYIDKCFQEGLSILNRGLSDIVVNGPVSKKHFLDNKYPGITEYIFNKSKKKLSKRPVMLIFNQKFSVSPITTHIPIKEVSKKLNENLIISNIKTINDFYLKKLKIKPRIATLGLNPHCETKSKINEENKYILPAIKKLIKEKINVNGPFSADTFFIRKNIKLYDVVIGMYHDQVLSPFKSIFEFDASNITLGISFLRISVDHGPNETMLGKNKSNTDSLNNIFNFINSIK